MNDKNLVNVSHDVAAEAIKNAGNKVKLFVKHKVPKFTRFREVELSRGPNGLGFTVAGGIDQPTYGIYVTQVLEGGAVAADGRISVGDRLIAVRNPQEGEGDLLLENCTHEEAVNALKRHDDKITLLVAKEETLFSFHLNKIIKRSQRGIN